MRITYGEFSPAPRAFLSGTQTGKGQIIRCYGVNPANIVVNPFPIPYLLSRPRPWSKTTDY